MHGIFRCLQARGSFAVQTNTTSFSLYSLFVARILLIPGLYNYRRPITWTGKTRIYVVHFSMNYVFVELDQIITNT